MFQITSFIQLLLRLGEVLSSFLLISKSSQRKKKIKKNSSHKHASNHNRLNSRKWESRYFGTNEVTKRVGIGVGFPPEGITLCARSSFANATSNHLPRRCRKENPLSEEAASAMKRPWPGRRADYGDDDDEDGGKDRPTSQKKKKKKKLLRKNECGRNPSSTDTDLVSWMWNVELWELRKGEGEDGWISRRTSNCTQLLGSLRTSSSSTFYRVVVVAGDNLLGLKDDGGFVVTPFVWTV